MRHISPSDYIKPELLVLIPVLYFIGRYIRESETVNNSHIPAILGICGVIMSMLWIVGTVSLTDYKDVCIAIFTALVQGFLCAGAAVYSNEIIKQSCKKD